MKIIQVLSNLSELPEEIKSIMEYRFETYSDLDGALRRLSNVENVLDNLEEHYIPSLNNYLKKDITELATLTTNVPNEQAYAYVYANNIPYKITLNDLADRVITTVNSGETKDLNINQYGFIEIEGE